MIADGTIRRFRKTPLLFLALFLFEWAGAGETLPFGNRLGFDLEAVYAHAPGHRPWKISGPVADGADAELDAENLQGSRRMIVHVGGEEYSDDAVLQFFNNAYFGGVESLSLVMDGDIPVLLAVEEDRTARAIPGLPFSILMGRLEEGMERARYAELMLPLADVVGEEPSLFAVSMNGTSWQVLAPGAVFEPGGDGRETVAALRLGTDITRDMFSDFLSEFYGDFAEPLHLKIGSGAKLAFGGLAEGADDDATPVEGLDNAGPEERWYALARELAAAMERDITAADPNVRITAVSPRLRYELVVEFDRGTAELSILRRRPSRPGSADASGGGAGRAAPAFRVDAGRVGTVFLDGVLLPDGTWWREERLTEGDAILSMRSLYPETDGVAGVRGLILAEWPDARDLHVGLFPALAEKTGCPAFRADFRTGGGAAGLRHVGAVLYRDGGAFWFDAREPAGTRSGAGGPSGEGDGLEGLLLRLENAPDEIEFPGTVAKVYMSGDVSVPEAAGAVMTALIRIKREAAPVKDSSPGAVAAFRYDGRDDSNGEGGMHLFSYGGDSPVKFTAERHFGVDGRGSVYEMDIHSGGEYRRIP